jgi:hypothetical protein
MMAPRVAASSNRNKIVASGVTVRIDASQSMFSFQQCRGRDNDIATVGMWSSTRNSSIAGEGRSLVPD